MAKICVDVRCLTEGRRTGVEEYLLNLLLALLKKDRDNEYILFFNSWKKAKFDFSIFQKYPNVRIKKSRIPNKILNFLFWYFNWPKIDKLAGGADIVFMPNIIFGAVSKNVRIVSTAHDLSFERYPEYFSLKRRLWHIFVNPKKFYHHSDKIIAVSDSTKNDLINLYKIHPDKIQAIYSSVADKFAAIDRNNPNLLKVKEKYGLPFKFLLYFGTLEPRKNIQAVILAFEEFKRHIRKNDLGDLDKYKLVIAGQRGWLYQEIFRRINESEFSKDIKVVTPICEQDKVFFYNLASFFIFPSFFEGFGFPPLEAMRSGIPVIAGNNSSLPEVVGDSGILIDSDKPEEIFRAMRDILSNRELKELMIERGLKKAGEFKWGKGADGFLDLIKKMV